MKSICQLTKTASENHLWKGFLSDFYGVILGHIGKAPPVSVICIAVKVGIIFQDFAYTLDTLIGYICKQTTGTWNLCDSNKHTIDATEKSAEKC